MVPLSDDFEAVYVTPEVATEFLSRNVNNRNVRTKKVQAYAEDMANGDWKWNGETVKFDTNGDMIDGQHRMLAVIESGCTIRFLLVYGLEPEAQDTVDTGMKRTMADSLRMKKEANPNDLAALLRKVYIWPDTVTLDKGTVPTNAQLFAVLADLPDLREVTRIARNMAKDCFLPTSVFAYSWYKFSQLSEEDCADFFEKLRTLDNIPKGHPIHTLYHTLRREFQSDHSSRSDVWLTAVVIKAWNRYRAGEDATYFDYRPGGKNPEKAPIPR